MTMAPARKAPTSLFVPLSAQAEFYLQPAVREIIDVNDLESEIAQAIDGIGDFAHGLVTPVLTFRKARVSETYETYLELLKFQYGVAELPGDAAKVPSRKRLSQRDEYLKSYEYGEEEDSSIFSVELVNLGANRNSTVDTVRESSKRGLAGASVLAATVLHTNWIRRMGCKRVPNVLVPGWEKASVPGHSCWNNVLSISQMKGIPVISSTKSYVASPNWAVPAMI